MIAAKPIIGATAMVYGLDMAANLQKLGQYVSHAELLLYWTPQENNFPDKAEVQLLQRLAAGLGLSLSVHLPPLLNLVTAPPAERRRNIALVQKLIEDTRPLNPTAYVLHLGPNPPVMCSNPARYINADTRRDLANWYACGAKALETLQADSGLGAGLLVENLDFSPLLLRPFLECGLAGLCFDAGHIWLGGETLAQTLPPLAPYVKEMHLHGVKGPNEHLSLSVLSPARRAGLGAALSQNAFSGPVVLEVFSAEDFAQSLNVINSLMGETSSANGV